MGNVKYNTKMLGVVTLYKPNVQTATANIRKYICDIDVLIVWDNSPFSDNLQSQLKKELAADMEKIVWHGDGNNHFIAPAINYALEYANNNDFDSILIMDQDSEWEDFGAYRNQIEQYMGEKKKWVYTPNLNGGEKSSKMTISEPYYFIRLFINSGTVIPTEILNAINGVDEIFALDALDHDTAIRIQKAGFQIVCLTGCFLNHTVGHPRRTRFLRLFTNDYGRERTYSIAKTHLIKYRKHKSWFTCKEKRKIFKEYYMWKIIRIIFAEKDKWGRFVMLIKGIKDGMQYDLTKTKR